MNAAPLSTSIRFHPSHQRCLPCTHSARQTALKQPPPPFAPLSRQKPPTSHPNSTRTPSPRAERSVRQIASGIEVASQNGRENEGAGDTRGGRTKGQGTHIHRSVPGLPNPLPLPLPCSIGRPSRLRDEKHAIQRRRNLNADANAREDSLQHQLQLRFQHQYEPARKPKLQRSPDFEFERGVIPTPTPKHQKATDDSPVDEFDG
ncbi:hypothetical protein CCMSSC00406_0009557 [Pleurotus cornucopiae]|uniref:Uncharacterized protein n=1 Tax=Pleurotus cornucopiae TaxID=5321 RepID=A0ACB7IT43_PLECO|nr:hypothetical protein CCMSSC00406_0009557 [Pleurotus cornucopiae]